MNVFKINVKLYVEDPSGLSHEQFVPVFHSWIQNHAVPGHTLIDVADYSHVQNGPGTVLVAHEANFYLDKLDGFLGFTYSRKQPAPGDFGDRLRQAFAAAIDGCLRLEDDARFEGRMKFRTDEILVQLNDRLLGPNTPETFAAVKPELEKLAAELWPGANVDIEYIPAEQTLFEVRLRADQSPYLPQLRNRLPEPATA